VREPFFAPRKIGDIAVKVVVVGTGYVGLVTGACLASVGNRVTCVDTNQDKIAQLKDGIIPIHEPTLDEYVISGVRQRNLHFSTSLEKALDDAPDFVFIAVGTPPDEDGSADLTHVVAVAREIGAKLRYPTIVVDKSTVPVGTAELVESTIQTALNARDEQPSFTVVSNPEFLKEGTAIEDFLRPARVIVGTDCIDAAEAMRELYAPFTRNHDRLQVMGVRDSEFTKYAANAMLATRISFMNELAVLCDRIGVDVEKVRSGLGSDPRIGPNFLYAGVGYGGSCFPKDVKALIKTGSDHGVEMGILHAVEERNAKQKRYLIEKIVAHYQGNVEGKRFALWGLAFKAGTDDMREAPANDIIAALLEEGASVVAHDPVAEHTARKAFPSGWLESGKLAFAGTTEESLRSADALVVITDWKHFRAPHWPDVAEALADRMVFDGRNLYSRPELARHGLGYVGIGR
jgi:UDPglucose 6-dehydrogenase